MERFWGTFEGVKAKNWTEWKIADTVRFYILECIHRTLGMMP
jgi:hypothetical protein